MKDYAYRALFETGDRSGNIVVTFPDVPEVVTQGRGEADARDHGRGSAWASAADYLARGKPLRKPRGKGSDLVDISGNAGRSGQAAVLEYLLRGISKTELARRIGKDEKEVRRIATQTSSKLPALTAALRALGKRLVVGVMEAEAA